MQNKITDAITRQLDEIFGGQYRIYTDAVEQGLETPCFFVGCIGRSVKPLLGSRALHTWNMRIQFLSEENAEQSAVLRNEVSDILAEQMEYITLEDGSLMRGTGREAKDSDGVLTFLEDFQATMIRQRAETETMDELDLREVSG